MGIDKKTIFIIFIVFILALFSGWFLARYTVKKDIEYEMPVVTNELPQHNQTESEKQIIKVFYPSGDVIVVDEIAVKKSHISVVFAEDILLEYLKRLRVGTDVRLNNVYMDRNNVIYIDISDDLRRGFSGDAIQEYNLLKSLFETLYRNITDLNDVRIFIDGREIEGIGGHFYTIYGLKDLFLNESKGNINEQ